MAQVLDSDVMIKDHTKLDTPTCSKASCMSEIYRCPHIGYCEYEFFKLWHEKRIKNAEFNASDTIRAYDTVVPEVGFEPTTSRL